MKNLIKVFFAIAAIVLILLSVIYIFKMIHDVEESHLENRTGAMDYKESIIDDYIC